MKTTVTESDFIDAFRSIRPDNFSIEGLRALFEYFEQLEDDIGEEIELDVIAICCEYSEFENLEEYNDQYGKDFDDVDQISYYTSLIQIEGTDRFIIADY